MASEERDLERLIDFLSSPVQRTLDVLLKDRSTGKNIIWATDPPDELTGCTDKHPITLEQLRSTNYSVIQPRMMKQSSQQQERTKKKGEVFTPAWVCCLMNNQLDEQWFRRKSRLPSQLNGQEWKNPEEPIFFPKGRKWQTYVDSRRLEICCGEAPFLVNRYDSATGQIIPIKQRIGLLDRKLRVVNENAEDEKEWLKWAKRAIQSTYGYEYQGDNLLLARINVLLTFQEYYEAHWKRMPTDRDLMDVAEYISWNLWQMDGLKKAVPFGKPYQEAEQISILGLFWAEEEHAMPCTIKDWQGHTKHVFTNLREGAHPMKFDFVIGNPPYQEEDGGAQASARPVYQLFFESARNITNRGICLVMPARWYAGGRGLDEFRDNILDDEHIKALHDYPNTADLFPNVNIRGGVCVISWDKEYDNRKSLVKFVVHDGRKETTSLRALRYEGSDILIRNIEAISILEKVKSESAQGDISKYVSPLRPFGIRSYFSQSEGFHSTPDGLSQPVMCVAKRRQVGYVELQEVLSHREWIDRWKVYVPRANNIGTELNDDNQNSFVGEPGSICTEAYICIGAELGLNKDSAHYLAKYLQTKFARFLHSLAKSSQDASSKTYRFVPIQNFAESSDINWTLSFAELDHQLYRKYELVQSEIDFIESHIKEMN